jgi:hypothetical protein
LSIVFCLKWGDKELVAHEKALIGVLFYGGVIFMAWLGHWVSHAKHWMQSASLTGSDFFSEIGFPGASPQS